MLSKLRMKQLGFVLICATLLAGCNLVWQGQEKNTPAAQADFSSFQDHQLIPIKIGNAQLTVEVVNSAASLTQGLSDRETIGSDGMLFILPERQVAEFWMFRMKFPLDFVWIDGASVVGVIEDVPAPTDITTTQLPTYSSVQPVTAVLELDAGQIKNLNLAKGATLMVETLN